MTLREIAIEFLRLVAAGEVDAAYERHVASDFQHHNAYFRGDRESLRQAMQDNARKNPDKQLDVKLALQDGERVATLSHVRLRPGDCGLAVAHMFRFEGTRIAELWDLGQPIPEDSVNENGMF
jgi:predicted SnoaL-like aldol condensation-catalyzing enzyme